MPREHTSIVTQKGTLKSEIRTTPMIHHSDIYSVLVLKNISLSYFQVTALYSQVVHLYVTQKDPRNQSKNTTLFGYKILIFITTLYKNNTDCINSVFKPTK